MLVKRIQMDKIGQMEIAGLLQIKRAMGEDLQIGWVAEDGKTAEMTDLQTNKMNLNAGQIVDGDLEDRDVGIVVAVGPHNGTKTSRQQLNSLGQIQPETVPITTMDQLETPIIGLGTIQTTIIMAMATIGGVQINDVFGVG